jgi:hypothetical protein
MPTTVGGKELACTTSNHQAVSPPAMSNIPPMTPATPPGVPAPFPYMGRSNTASKTASKLKINGGEALITGSEMSVDPPGNQPSQPAPLHDVVTMMVNQKIIC